MEAKEIELSGLWVLGIFILLSSCYLSDALIRSAKISNNCQTEQQPQKEAGDNE